MNLVPPSPRPLSRHVGQIAAGALAGFVFFGLSAMQAFASDRTTLDLEKKAEYWTAHGRDDLATQTYQQLLFLNPENRPALIGLASDALRHGTRRTAEGYIRKIRDLNPDDPTLPGFSRELEVGPLWTQSIEKARESNSRHLYGQALTYYRTAFGPYPPPPQYAVEYYNDLIHTGGGYHAAVNQLHRLTKRYPDSFHYRLALGLVLSYDPSHRWEALDILKPMAEESSPVSNTATAAWRQILIWEGTLPRNIVEMRSYLARHSDPAIKRQLELAEKRALAMGPESKAAYHALDQARFDEAVLHFRTLVAKDPDNPGPWIGLSYAYLGLRKFDQAQVSLDRARKLRLSPSQRADTRSLKNHISFWNFMERAKQDEATSDLAGAGADLLKAGQIFPDNPDLLIAQAGLAARQGQRNRGEALYRKAIALRPGTGAPWAGLLALYERNGEDRKALAELSALSPELLRSLGEDPDFLMASGRVYRRTGHPDRARKAFAQALASTRRVSPDRKLAWAWSLYSLDERAPLATLLGRLDRESGLSPSDLASLRTLHHLVAQREENLLLQKRQFKPAFRLMKAHAARHPDDRFYREEEARILEAWGKKKEAWALVRDLGPGTTLDSFEAATGLAMATGHDLQAEIWLGDAKGRWPGNLRLTLLEARLEQSRGHFKKSDRILRKALVRDPRDPRILLALADNDRSMGRYGRAKEEIRLALSDTGGPAGTGEAPFDRSAIEGQAQTALEAVDRDEKKKTEGQLELMAGETAFTQYTQYYYAQIGDIIPLTGFGQYRTENGSFENPLLHLFLMGNYFTFEYHPTPSSASFLSQSYTGLTPAAGVRFPTSFGYWEGDIGIAVAQHMQTLTPPGTVTGLFLQSDLLWNLLGGGLDLFASYTGYINYIYFQSRYLTPAWDTPAHRFTLDLGPEFIVQGNGTYNAFQGGVALRLWAEPLRSSFLIDGGILSSSAFSGAGGYEGVTWYFLY